LQQETEALTKSFHEFKTTKEKKKKKKTKVELDSHLIVPKEEPKYSKIIKLRGYNKHHLEQSKQKQKELVVGDKARQVNRERKGKTMVNFPSRSKTRVTNKFRLKSKSLFNPSLKDEHVIFIEDNTIESAGEEKGQLPIVGP
jgi:ribosomal protein L44E